MEPGNTLANGRYVLTELVGAGGVGEVWRATDTVLDRTVAIKVLKPRIVEEFSAVRRFIAEARVMAKLDHRGIAAVYDFGHDADDIVYLVMRYVPGQPLRRIMDRVGPIPPDRVLRMLALAADALHAAHSAGVIHRDVKPGNLLIAADGGLVLTDFGIARAAGGAELTAAGLVVGTARYIAPEQASAGRITSAVDVYALGVTAYECLTGHVPFDGGSPIEIARQHVESPAPPLPTSVPAPVRELVMQMLAKQPQLRPTAAEVAATARATLAKFAAGELAEEESSGTRRRALALAGTGVLASLIAISLLAFGPDGSGAGSINDGLNFGVNTGINGATSPTPSGPTAASSPTVTQVRRTVTPSPSTRRVVTGGGKRTTRSQQTASPPAVSPPAQPPASPADSPSPSADDQTSPSP